MAAPRPIFPIDAVDVSPQVAASTRERDAHLGTLVIGIFLGSIISSCSMLLGAWVLT